MKIRIKKILSESVSGQLPPPRTKEQLASFVLSSKYNIDMGKKLGEGRYGLVVEGISDEFGPVAIKILDSSQPSAQREADIYKTVNEARSKSPNIKKHFPKVYHVDESSHPEITLIIMEILTVEQGLQHETISMLFGGLNTALRPSEDEKEVAADYDSTFRSRENRYYLMFKDKKSQDSILEQFSNYNRPELDFLKTTMKDFFTHLDAYVSNKEYSEKALQLLNIFPLSDSALTYINNWKTGKTKTMFQDAPWMLTFIIEQLDALFQHENKMLFAQFHESLIGYWLEWFRKNSPIGLKDGSGTRWSGWEDKGPEYDEQWEVFKEIESIKKAISDLKDITGLGAYDMHDKNVMIRPQTGDIVIVDLGLFR